MRNVVYYKKHNIMVYSQNPEKAQQVTAKNIAMTCLFIENIQLSCFYSEIFFLFLFIVDKSCKIHRRGVEQTCENVDYIA